MPIKNETKLGFFRRAREHVYASPFRYEIEWQRQQQLTSVTSEHFLRETAWVIVNSGFREATARQIFPTISLAFFDWADASLIVAQRNDCIEIASYSFNHPRKLSAMVDAAERVVQHGMDRIISHLEVDPIKFLMDFPFVGPVTAWHLAKNLGCDVAKPDRHLVRVANHFEYDCVHEFCAELGALCDEKVSVVDLIIWRFMASNRELIPSQPN